MVIHHNERTHKVDKKQEWFPFTDRVPQTMEEWIEAGHTND